MRSLRSRTGRVPRRFPGARRGVNPDDGQGSDLAVCQRWRAVAVSTVTGLVFSAAIRIRPSTAGLGGAVRRRGGSGDVAVARWAGRRGSGGGHGRRLGVGVPGGGRGGGGSALVGRVAAGDGHRGHAGGAGAAPAVDGVVGPPARGCLRRGRGRAHRDRHRGRLCGERGGEARGGRGAAVPGGTGGRGGGGVSRAGGLVVPEQPRHTRHRDRGRADAAQAPSRRRGAAVGGGGGAAAGGGGGALSARCGRRCAAGRSGGGGDAGRGGPSGRTGGISAVRARGAEGFRPRGRPRRRPPGSPRPAGPGSSSHGP